MGKTKFKETKKDKVAFPRRGEIYLVNFGPARGGEIKKTRPALILQNDLGNYFSSTTIVAPISSKLVAEIYDFEVLVDESGSGLMLKSKAKLDQIRAVDKARLIKKIGRVSLNIMKKVDLAIKVSLGLIDLS